MTVQSNLRRMADRLRGVLPNAFGVREYDVLMRVNTWSGPLAGQGIKSTTETPLLVNGQRCKVEQVSQRDIIASAGLYQDQDVKIGPLTPPFTNLDGSPGGVDRAIIETPLGGAGVEVLFKITGPAYPTGAWFERVRAELMKGNYHWTLVLRKLGVQNV